MGCPRGWPGAALALLLLLLLSLLAFCSAGRGTLDPTIDGQPRAVCTMREGESRAFTCWVPRPVPDATLAWYLNGQKQEANLSTAGTASTLTLTAQRSDHQLNCSLTNPASSETKNASILLNVQYKPEILRAGARYQEVEGADLLLVLFVLVQANPPASITWVDQDGHVMANASEFLLLGTTSYPGLANRSLHIHLRCTAGNLSISAANSVGITTTSLLPTAVPSTHSPRAHACPARPGPCHPTCASVTLHRKTKPPPRMQVLVRGEKRVPCWDWRTPWSSGSSVLSTSQCLGASTKCPAQAVMRFGCELQHGACEPGLPGTRYVPAPGAAQPRVPGRP